jgi:sulfide:quinone oxidoreductase
MSYIDKYGVDLNYQHRLTAVDGPNKRATFVRTLPDGSSETRVEAFDMLHVVPPQVAPDFIRQSPLADAAGWVDVDPHTLRHRQFGNIHAWATWPTPATPRLPPLRASRRRWWPTTCWWPWRLPTLAQYDGYGSCPLTVERGKIVLAEFTYGGKVAPSFPRWLLDGRKPTAWPGCSSADPAAAVLEGHAQGP